MACSSINRSYVMSEKVDLMSKVRQTKQKEEKKKKTIHGNTISVRLSDVYMNFLYDVMNEEFTISEVIRAMIDHAKECPNECTQTSSS